MASQPPAPIDRQRLGRGLIVGAALSIFGVGLFLVLYFGLLGANVASAPRLFISMCVPPAIIAVLIGVYVLWRRMKR